MRRCAPLVLVVAALGCVPPSRQPTFAANAGPATPVPASEPPAPPETTPETPPPAPAAQAPAEAETPPESGSDPAYADSEEGESDVDDHEDGAGAAAKTTPKIELTDEQIAQKARQEPASLGSLSMGTPNVGYLINGVQMPTHDHWQIIGAPSTWGTQETVDFLARAIHAVNKQFPNTPPIFIGHISAKHGGYLSPHKSHQAGRDVDLGYYYNRDARWFERAHAQNIDLPRTWALIKTLINETDVDMIFVDTSLQHLLARHAAGAGEDSAYLDRVFQIRGKSQAPIIRHVKGHATHIHVRFHSPMAQEMGRRAQRFFHRPAAALAKAPSRNTAPGQKEVVGSSHFVMHKARSGDVLVNLAKQYGTTPEAIIQANGIRGNSLKIGQMYRIPVPAKSGPADKAPPKKGAQHSGRSRG